MTDLKILVEILERIEGNLSLYFRGFRDYPSPNRISQLKEQVIEISKDLHQTILSYTEKLQSVRISGVPLQTVIKLLSKAEIYLDAYQQPLLPTEILVEVKRIENNPEHSDLWGKDSKETLKNLIYRKGLQAMGTLRNFIKKIQESENYERKIGFNKG